MLLRSAYRAARLRLPNMAQEPRKAVGMMLCAGVCVSETMQRGREGGREREGGRGRV